MFPRQIGCGCEAGFQFCLSYPALSIVVNLMFELGELALTCILYPCHRNLRLTGLGC
jgi:hypothetical protein